MIFYDVLFNVQNRRVPRLSQLGFDHTMSDISKLPLVKLELFVLLVYYGVKSAYLVDCCCINEMQAQSFLEYFHLKFDLKHDAVLTVVLESDILFVNREALSCKIINLQQQSDLPLIIDMGSTLTILAESNHLFKLVCSTFKAILSADNNSRLLVVPITTELNEVVGLPLIAGWLLGYPCLYRATSSIREDTELFEDSTVINLLKFSISATVDVRALVRSEKVIKGQKMKAGAHRTAQHTGPTSQIVEVIGFSIPENLWKSDVRTQLSDRFHRILGAMKEIAECLNNSHQSVKVSCFEAEQEVHTVPKIAL